MPGSGVGLWLDRWRDARLHATRRHRRLGVARGHTGAAPSWRRRRRSRHVVDCPWSPVARSDRAARRRSPLAAWIVVAHAAPDLLELDRSVDQSTGLAAVVGLLAVVAVAWLARVARRPSAAVGVALLAVLVLPGVVVATRNGRCSSCWRAARSSSLVLRPERGESVTRVALPLLTLVPGISGGSETYARELCRALARVGDARLRGARADARDRRRRRPPDRRSRPATGPRRQSPAGSARWGAPRSRPGRSGAHLDHADVVHYPLTVPCRAPRVPTVLTLLDVQHLDLPELFPRGERLFRRLAYDRAARRADQVVVISEWVRERVVERLGLDSGARSRGPPRRRPRAVHARSRACGASRSSTTPRGRGRTRTTTRLFEAFALLRRERPELRLVLTGVGHDAARLPDGRRGARRRLASTSASRCTAARLRSCSRASTRASGCRRSRRWPAAARCRLERRIAARGRRRRGGPLRPAPTPTAIAAGVAEALAPCRRAVRARARARRGASRGTRRRAPTTASTSWRPEPEAARGPPRP